MKKILIISAPLMFSTCNPVAAGSNPVQITYDQYGNQVVSSVQYGGDVPPSNTLPLDVIPPSKCPVVDPKPDYFDLRTGYLHVEQVNVGGVLYWATIRVDGSNLVAFGRK